jgi:hypothetical protein
VTEGFPKPIQLAALDVVLRKSNGIPWAFNTSSDLGLEVLLGLWSPGRDVPEEEATLGAVARRRVSRLQDLLLSTSGPEALRTAGQGRSDHAYHARENFRTEVVIVLVAIATSRSDWGTKETADEDKHHPSAE